MSSIAVAFRRIPNSVEVVAIMVLAFGWYIYRSTRWALMDETIRIWWKDPGANFSFVYNDRHPLGTLVGNLIVLGITFFLLRRRGWSFSDLNLQNNWKYFAHGIILFLIFLGFAVVRFDVLTVFIPEAATCMIPSAGEEVGGIYWVLMMMIDPVYHEFFLLCYLFKRLDQWNPVAIVALSTLIRLSYQIYFGPEGWLLVFVFGIVAGCYYYKFRNLTAPILMHFLWNFIVVIRDMDALRLGN